MWHAAAAAAVVVVAAAAAVQRALLVMAEPLLSPWRFETEADKLD